MKELFFLIFFYLIFYLNAQVGAIRSLNKSYHLAEEFIDSCEKGNYISAKNIWEQRLKYEKTDPRQELWIAHYAFKNADTTLFKTIINKLISQNGFQINIGKDSFLSFYEAVTIGKWKSFYLKSFKEGNKIFILNNIDKVPDFYFLNELYRYDQLHTIPTSKSDSCCTKLTEHLASVDRYIYGQLLTLCNKYNTLPNNFDFDYLATRKVEVMIQHLMYDSTQIKKVWEGFLPYYKTTFEEGKITNDLIYIYDKYLNIHFHYQYYGTILNVKVIDEGGLDVRQKFFLIK